MIEDYKLKDYSSLNRRRKEDSHGSFNSVKNESVTGSTMVCLIEIEDMGVKKRILTDYLYDYRDYTLVKTFNIDSDGTLYVEDDIDVLDFNYTNGYGSPRPLNLKNLIIKSSSPIIITRESLCLGGIENVSITCPHKLFLEEGAFYRCNTLKNVELKCSGDEFEEVVIGNSCFNDSTIESITIDKVNKLAIHNKAFYGCKNLKDVDFDDNFTIIMPNAFSRCDSLKEYRCSPITKIYKYAFDCNPNLERIHMDNFAVLSLMYDGAFYKNMSNTIIEVGCIKVSELYTIEPYDNFLFDNLIIDDLTEYGINKLNKILSIYDKKCFKRITAGDFDVKLDILDLDHKIDSSFEIINNLDTTQDITSTLLLIDSIQKEKSNFLNAFINNYKKEVIEKNVSYFRQFDATSTHLVFLSSPDLFKIDFDIVFTNLAIIRENATITDDDIRIFYFDDNNLTINLDDMDSINNYLCNYIKENKRLPRALNSLFCNSTYDDIIDRVDRLNYVTTMHYTGREKDEFLCKDSVEIIKSIDDENFNRIFGDYKDRASKTNSKVPYLEGIKTLVYEKLRGYIYQDENENILFDEVFNEYINDFDNTFIGSRILDYFDTLPRHFSNRSAKELEYKKNIICGRILYTIISRLKSECSEEFTEEYVREKLYDFKNIRKGLLSTTDLFYTYLDSAFDPECIEILLKIDPYAFDMFRNYTGTLDVPINTQLDNLIEKPINSGNLVYYENTDIRRKAIQNRGLTEDDKGSYELLIGFDDVRYYKIAKANGYRFSKEEEEGYERRIDAYNSQLEEALNDPKYSKYKEQLLRYKIKDINTQPDIMKVFYEFLQNQVVPSNIPINRRHDFEDRVKVLVNEYIESGSREGTRLSKIIYSVDMLYRTNNPSILYKSREEIIENPVLISNPDISDIEKIGIALVALNKMAHQQIDDFIPSDYLTRYRYKSNELMTETQEFAKNVVDAFTILGNYNDIEFTYKELFKEKGVLKNNRFYDYIDNGDYEKVYLLHLDKSKCNEIYNYVVSNYSELKRLYKNKNTKEIPTSIVDYYRENKLYIDYIFRNSNVDENKKIIVGKNPLLLNEDEISDIYNRFTRWVNYYDDSRDINDTRELMVEDYVRIFRSLRKVRSYIKEKPDVVEHLLDNAISQRNMYDLKTNFSTILMNSLVEELSNSNNLESTDIINRIVNFTKDDKINMFNSSGIVIEIQEDNMNPKQDVLVIYSKNVREPYSIHLTYKVIKDDITRKKVKDNQIIINSKLDNKNLTYNDRDYSFDFNNKRIDFDFNFKSGDKGRPNALLLNFLTVEIPSLLSKYNISREELSDILNNNKKTDNSIINGIITMINNLINTNTLQLPEDLELDSEFDYLKGIKFSGINNKYISTIRGLLGNNRIMFDNTQQENLDSIVEDYKEKLKDTNSSTYNDTLKEVFIDLTTLHDRILDDNTINKVCYFGDNNIKYGLSQNKAFKLLNRFNKVIDMSLIDDIDYRDIVEKYISRICFNRASIPKKDIDKLKEMNLIINELNNNYFRSDKFNIYVYNIRDEFKNTLIEELNRKINDLNSKIKPVKSNNELLDMFNDNSNVEVLDDKKSKK